MAEAGKKYVFCSQSTTVTLGKFPPLTPTHIPSIPTKPWCPTIENMPAIRAVDIEGIVVFLILILRTDSWFISLFSDSSYLWFGRQNSN